MNVAELFGSFGTFLAILVVLLPLAWKFSGQMQRLSDSIGTLFKRQDCMERELKIIDDRTRKTDIHIAEIHLSIKHIEQLLQQHIDRTE
jgi:hypothetical protein